MLLRNKKTGLTGIVDTTVIMPKGTLYTVKYIDGTYRRYYDNKFTSLFEVLDDEWVSPNESKQNINKNSENNTQVINKPTDKVYSRQNVIEVDFKLKKRVG